MPFRCVLPALLLPKYLNFDTRIGCVQPSAAQGAARHPETLLEGRPVVAFLLRLKLWWCADFHRAPVHRTAANTTLNTKDGVASALSLSALNGGACRAPGQANLVETNLSKANLSEIKLILADLRGANLEFADLSKANLSEADLSRVNLEGANLIAANLNQVNLSGANLTGVNLQRANLIAAKLILSGLQEQTWNKQN